MKPAAVLAAAAFFAPLAFGQTAPAPAANCQVLIKETLPLEFDDTGRVTVPVSFNNKPYRMMVDTGDYYSVITLRVANDLGLKVSMATNFALWGWGGRPIFNVTDVDAFALGRLKSGNTTFMVADWYGMADGLLGADFLYYFDLDFDFVQAKLKLISPEHCKGKVVYWTKGDYGTVPFEYKDRKIRLKVRLDGKEVEAYLDTGADDTIMSKESAADLFGLKEDELAKDKKTVAFKVMSFGGVVVNNPSVKLVSDRESGVLGGRGPEMIIGMTVLRRLHLYIAYGENALYVTPATQY